MCGIFATTGGEAPPPGVLEHRGPDASSIKKVKNVTLVFHRLAINGLTSEGMQPIEHNGKTLIANAEIYNYIDLDGVKGESDCKVILPNIEKWGLTAACHMFSGDFAFVYTDGDNIWAARDRVGVRPLFYCRHPQGIAFASEAKGLLHFQSKIEIFPPGHIYDSKFDEFICWASRYWDGNRDNANIESITDTIDYYLNNAVQMRIESSERPLGFFLSGGLDSSIIAALGKKFLGKINTFAIGLEGAPDLLAARTMAKFLDSDHTEVIFTIEEGIREISNVIWHLETYDTTTIRASIPMFLLSKYIKENTDIRVVLSGEGSDELFGGYLYFHAAPSTEAFKMETVRLVRDVHMFDVLRADRTTSAHGIELRVPFFDRDLIDYVMEGFVTELKIPKNKCEKYILRDTFSSILPPEIAWRQKNGMSDAVGYAWAQALRDFGEDNYKTIFNKFFGDNDHLSPYKWMPKWIEASDPSGAKLPFFTGDPPPPCQP
jgi:asparagine synthase (glutamine-hydrolysing)